MWQNESSSVRRACSITSQGAAPQACGRRHVHGSHTTGPQKRPLAIDKLEPSGVCLHACVLLFRSRNLISVPTRPHAARALSLPSLCPAWFEEANANGDVKQISTNTPTKSQWPRLSLQARCCRQSRTAACVGEPARRMTAKHLHRRPK